MSDENPEATAETTEPVSEPPSDATAASSEPGAGTEAPPAEAPPAEAPPEAAPPGEAPSAEAPPEEIPSAEAPPAAPAEGEPTETPAQDAAAEEVPKTEEEGIQEKESKHSKSLHTVEEVPLSEKKSGESQGDKKSSITRGDAVSSESIRKSSKLKAVESREGRRVSRIGSKAQKLLGSTISIRRLSVMGDLYDKSKAARYMNSYKLDSDNPFNSDKVRNILEEVMVEAFEGLTYDSDKCPKQAKWASSNIRGKVKDLQFERYKIISLVTIGEKTSQDILIACRFLWDPERDRYAVYSLETTNIFGLALCFGIYYE